MTARPPYEVGARVKGWWGHNGSVRYVGRLENAPLEVVYIGVEWDDPTHGKSDGCFQGKRYFHAPPGSCTFVTPDQVTPAERKELDEKRLEQALQKAGRTKELKLDYVTLLPDWGQLPTGLTRVSLCDNNLRHVPPCLESMVSLQSLKLSRNELTILPDYLPRLPLKTLWLDGNQLSALPLNFPQLTGLQELRLHNNEALDYPIAVIDRGIGSVITYIEHTDHGVQQKLYEDWKWREEQTAKETETIRAELRECFLREREEAAERLKMEKQMEEEFIERRKEVLNEMKSLVESDISLRRELADSRSDIEREEVHDRLCLERETGALISTYQDCLRERDELQRSSILSMQQETHLRIELEFDQHVQRMAIERGRLYWERDKLRQMMHEQRQLCESQCTNMIEHSKKVFADTERTIQQQKQEWEAEVTRQRQELDVELKRKRNLCNEEVQSTRDRLARQVRELAGLKADCDREVMQAKELMSSQQGETEELIASKWEEHQKLANLEILQRLKEQEEQKKQHRINLEKQAEDMDRELRAKRKEHEERMRREREDFDQDQSDSRHRMEQERRHLFESMAQVAEERALGGCSVPPQDSIQSVGVNVGGHLYMSSRTTLCSVPDNFFNKLLSGTIAIPYDTAGNIFIDRNGENFAVVMTYLRYGTVSLTHFKGCFKELQADSDFFGLPDMEHIIEQEKKRRQNENPLVRCQAIEAELSDKCGTLESQIRRAQADIDTIRQDDSRHVHQSVASMATTMTQHEAKLKTLSDTLQELYSQLHCIDRTGVKDIATISSDALRQQADTSRDLLAVGRQATSDARSVAGLEARLNALERDLRAPAPSDLESEAPTWDGA